MTADLRTEVRVARESAAVCDRSDRGKLRVTGADRQTFLNNMLSNDLASRPPGSGCRAELLDDRGHVVADLRVYVGDTEILLDLEPGLAPAAKQALEKFVIMDDAVFEDVSEAYALFTVCGPRAETVVASATKGIVPSDAPYAHLPCEVGGVAGRVSRTRWTAGGARDFDLLVPRDRAETARDALRAAVLAVGGGVIFREAFETLRIEAGIARQGADLDQVIPLEARLEREAVSFTKGCYLGQEIVARIVARGHVNRLLVGLALEGDAVPRVGAAVRHEGKEVGRVTSATSSPTVGRPIALAYVRREHAAAGTKLFVSLPAGEGPAVVADLPFVP